MDAVGYDGRMTRALHLPVALFAAACLGLACQSKPAPRTGPAPQTPAPQATPMPTTPPHLTPRPDGTYVDARGNVLTPPPVMPGVTMEQPGPALATHLGVNPARCALLVDVIPGLPADKAGLKDHDLVVAVDGSGDASPHDIRRRLRSMKTGDSITFTVQRGTQTGTFTVTAADWKAEHMVRPLHMGSFNKPGLGRDAESDPAPPELAPVIDRLDRIEQQLKVLQQQSTSGQPGVTPVPPAAAPRS